MATAARRRVRHRAVHAPTDGDRRPRRTDDPAALLLAGWLSARLGCEPPVEPAGGRAPGVGGIGVTSVRVELVDGGVVELTREDASRRCCPRTGQPDRDAAAGPSAPLGDELAEELRRLDADQPYAEALGAPPGCRGWPTGRTSRGR